MWIYINKALRAYTYICIILWGFVYAQKKQNIQRGKSAKNNK